MKKRRNWLATLSAMYLIILVVATTGASHLTAYDPLSIDLGAVLQPPNKAHPLGTDELGRDVFSRLLHGGRVSIMVGFAAMLIGVLVGTFYGAISGFAGGAFDRIMMRTVDALISIPSILLMIGIQMLLPSTLTTITLTIGFTSWMGLSRLVRAEILSIKGEVFVQASAVIGASSGQLLTRHMLPQTLPTLTVMAISGISHAILAETTLSFLGIGIPPHEPSWGNMLTGVQSFILSGVWWVALFPGIGITLTVLAVTFLGDALQDRFALPQFKGGRTI